MKRIWLVFLGLALVPLLISGTFLWAGWDSNSRLRELRAAVVNLDEPITLNGQYTPLGRQLVAALVDSNRIDNLTWKLAPESKAVSGLNDGTYVAMVVIPKTFSADATSFSGEAADATQANVQFKASPVAGVADAAVGRSVVAAAIATTNEFLAKSYLDQLYIGFNTMGEQYQKLADGSAKLSDGMGDLSSGLDEAASHTDELIDGGDTLAGGISQAADGVGKLADGVDAYVKGVGTAAKGAEKLVTASSSLAAGLKKLAKGVKALPSSTKQLADGASDLSDGVKQYTDGVNQLLDTFLPSLTELEEQRSAIDKQVLAVQAAAKSLASSLKTLSAQVKALQVDDSVVANAVKAARAEADKVECPQEFKDADLCDTFHQALGNATEQLATAALNSVRDQLASALAKTDDSGDTLGDVADDLSAAADALPDMLDQLWDGLKSLKALRRSGGQLASGAASLADGTKQLADAMPALSKGLTQTADGSGQLADGIKTFADGLDTAATKGKQLASGADKAASGLDAAADGAKQYVDGVGQLADGVVQAADGSGQLADGMKQMADGIADGAGQIPSYDASERDKLSTAVASPIADDLSAVVDANLGWGSVLIVLALWLGALACFLVFKPNSPMAVTSTKSSGSLFWATLRPGLIVTGAQVVLVAAAAEIALRLPAGAAVQVLLVLALAGGAFVFINHALAAWFGNAGRLACVVAAVLTAVFGLTGALPDFFNIVRGALPLTPALDALRGIVTGAAGVPANVAALVMWMAVAAVFSALSVARSRSVSLAALVADPV
ncbi:MAG: YhgE/Pip domain-containing protein [Propionibacteriaceae bacterium]|nr:YhgE/Pip domain-containing protein [Propionibacteriaceae bacterium]